MLSTVGCRKFATLAPKGLKSKQHHLGMSPRHNIPQIKQTFKDTEVCDTYEARDMVPFNNNSVTLETQKWT